MKNLFATAFLALMAASSACAQVVSSASFLKAQKQADVQIPFRFLDEGVSTPIEWGLDLAWYDEGNLRRGVAFAGKDLIDIVRTSYRPSNRVDNGELQDSVKKYVKTRAGWIKKYCKEGVSLNLNDDHAYVDEAWYNDPKLTSANCGKRWAQCIDLHIKEYAKNGLTNFVSISPFNEPDFGWSQGRNPEAVRMADMKAVVVSLRNDFDGAYDNVRMCGGNTLNDDRALEWWNYMKDVLDEGNTHQLAGDFAHYADFFQKVREYGHHATADELHNTMEAMVGVEYGMQTGIWWGTCEYTRSQFMKATDHKNPGRRLAYGEHRPNWTAASVYRHPDGSVQAFGGTSERQAVTTTYGFTAMDCPVWYNGEWGRDYFMTLPGGTGYQKGQVDAEMLVDIQSGEDIMPRIEEGVPYKVMNLNSGMVLGTDNMPGGWTSAKQKKGQYTNKNYQWTVKSTPQTGDFNYYTFRMNIDGNYHLDILNWSLDAGADVGAYANSDPGTNEQWFLQYAGDGAFYIGSRHSAKFLEVANSSKSASANVRVAEFTGKPNQKWRFVPAEVKTDLTAPAAVTGLTATAQTSSVALTWEPSASDDVASHNILRSADGGETYYTIAKYITGTAFTDNEAVDGVQYVYAVEAVDGSLNRSERAVTEPVGASQEQGEVMLLSFDDALTDATLNGNHAALSGTQKFATYRQRRALQLTGTNNTFVQLPYTVASHRQMTVSAWVYWQGGAYNQCLWSFSNGADQQMYLTPDNGGKMALVVKNGGVEKQLTATRLSSTGWRHVVVTISDTEARIFVDGKQLAESKDITGQLTDFHPVHNYIGRGPGKEVLLKGYVDDFAIYNYALTPEQVQDVTDGMAPIVDSQSSNSQSSNGKYDCDLQGRRVTKTQKGIVVSDGKKTIRK